MDSRNWTYPLFPSDGIPTTRGQRSCTTPSATASYAAIRRASANLPAGAMATMSGPASSWNVTIQTGADPAEIVQSLESLRVLQGIG